MKLPGLLPISILILAAVLAGLIPVLRELNFGAIKEWQVLIGFAGTIVAGWVAWLNVGRQIRAQRTTMRMNLLSREEDRIEGELPQLRLAGFYLQNLAVKVAAVQNSTSAFALLNREKLIPPAGKRQADMIKEHLPDANEWILREVAKVIGKVLASGRALNQSNERLKDRIAERIELRKNAKPTDDGTSADQAVDVARRELQNTIGDFQATAALLFAKTEEFVARIRQREKTLSDIRSEMEKYFSA